MTHSRLSDPKFNRMVSLSEMEEREANIRCNDAFVLAMAKAVRRGKEKVTVGTFVDLTPPIHAVKIRGVSAMSCCGSPAAECVDTGALGNGTATLR